MHREQSRVRKHLITAPFSGVVVMLGVDPGDVVAGGQVVARVISEDQGVRFAVPPAMRASARPGAAVSVVVPGVSQVVRGQVTDVLPEVDAASGMVFSRARLDTALPSDLPLVAGTSVRVSFEGAAP
jgi:multidrug efflux pump subunit AcrA (membrane-fusion protein)